jgi:hypothetical protein
MKSRGVVNVIINGKQMDAGRFLFNLDKDSPEELKASLSKKFDEFFRWYGNFNNKDPIDTIELVTNEVVCEMGCAIPLNFRFSVIDILLKGGVIREMLIKYATKYDVEIQLDV